MPQNSLVPASEFEDFLTVLVLWETEYLWVKNETFIEGWHYTGQIRERLVLVSISTPQTITLKYNRGESILHLWEDLSGFYFPLKPKLTSNKCSVFQENVFSSVIHSWK